jgi:DNA-binding LacI/PurR family transcriptional regulator
VIGVEPASPGARLEPEGVMGRRMRGYVQALADRGVELPPHAFVVGPASIEGGIAAMRHAVEGGMQPTGVLVMSDAMAIGVLRAAREMGLRVPEDVSVVGFDDIDISQHTNPPLTTVHQPIRQKGESAVRLLLSVVERRDQRPEQIRLETRLIIRGSTGPAPRRRQEVPRGRH